MQILSCHYTCFIPSDNVDDYLQIDWPLWLSCKSQRDISKHHGKQYTHPFLLSWTAEMTLLLFCYDNKWRFPADPVLRTLCCSSIWKNILAASAVPRSTKISNVVQIVVVGSWFKSRHTTRRFLPPLNDGLNSLLASMPKTKTSSWSGTLSAWKKKLHHCGIFSVWHASSMHYCLSSPTSSRDACRSGRTSFQISKITKIVCEKEDQQSSRVAIF